VDYWRKALQNIGSMDVVTSYHRPEVATYAGSIVSTVLRSSSVHAQICNVARGVGVTPFTVHLAAWFISLLPFARQSRFALGMYTDTRSYKERHAMGLFINTLCIVADMSENPTLEAFISALKTAISEAFAHREVPFDVVVKELGLTSKLGGGPQPPLLQGGMSFEVGESAITTSTFSTNRGQAQLKVLELDRGCAETELRMYVQTSSLVPQDAYTTITLEYSTEVFSKSAAQLFLESYVDVLSRLSGDMLSIPIQHLLPDLARIHNHLVARDPVLDLKGEEATLAMEVEQEPLLSPHHQYVVQYLQSEVGKSSQTTHVVALPWRLQFPVATAWFRFGESPIQPGELKHVILNELCSRSGSLSVHAKLLETLTTAGKWMQWHSVGNVVTNC
jgi:non-ribosomal peptide synthetase component F